MPTQEIARGPVSPSSAEGERIQALDRLLSEGDKRGESRYILADSAGRQVELPPSLLHVLLLAVRGMARGQSVVILRYDHELTTQQAAELLGVSRPYLIRLLEQGQIPYHKVGTHRRIRMGDLLSYKERRDQKRREELRELRRVSEALGLYDENSEP